MGVQGKDKIADMAKRHQEAAQGRFVKLENDGDKIVVAFLGEPFAKEVVWIGDEGARKSEEYDAAKHGPEKTAKPKMRVLWNVYDFERKEVRIIEQGVTFYRVWQVADDKYGKKWAMEIKRNGRKGDKKTTYSVFPERELTADELTALAKLDVHDLANTSSGEEESGGSDGGVVDADTANKLIAELKALRESGKAETLTEFLKTFGVEAIRDVPKSRGEEALQFVAKLKGSSAAAPAAEKDPFA